ncbi:MAG TPA: hypothetical protein VFO60_07515 [Candidatus Dormibacteraeota bacterium]|nr:hypothetical protein [Candidatus Dormibacteraeota bacterium]
MPRTVHVGSIVDLRFGGSPTYAWERPTDSNAGVLAPQSVAITRGSLNASYLAVRPGTATLSGTRSSPCPPPSPSANVGICASQMFNVYVTVIP